MVLRSSKANGDWSFKKQENEQKIKEIVARFAHKFGVRILSLGIVGNHLHFHLKLGNRFAYKPFVRGLTASIAMAVTGVNRWTRVKGVGGKGCASASEKFWDYRPFTRVVRGLRALLTLKDYIDINHIEGFGVKREEAQYAACICDAALRPHLKILGYEIPLRITANGRRLARGAE
ncbi:MAG: transposase [Bdellovibrionia bacterium]